jgi:HPt (histidine-containing phosphotransfer) domain-containing protein
VLETLRELQIEGEPDLLGELIDLFGADTPPLMDAMRAAIASQNADALRQAAHSAKSSSANLGAAILAGLLKQLEEAGRAGVLDSAPALFAQAEAELDRVFAALDREKASVLSLDHKTA